MNIRLGPYRLRNGVLLAPMAGVTDAPFRAAAWRLGAGLVVSEMVAGKELLAGQGGTANKHRRRLRGAGRPACVQLAGHDPEMMARAARAALLAGARAIDINMGCPAKMVTGKLSGAALMREPDRARAIIAAVVRAAREHGAPVSVKMRLGWDDGNRNAPDIACMAADLGVAMLTVHGRTRRQFYDGRADWRAVGQVKRALNSAGHAIPLIVNGDVTDAETARRALAQSGADGVMIGRAALGRPWLCGEIAGALWPGAGIAPLAGPEQVVEIADLCASMAAFHGETQGVRRARKHLKAALAHWRAAGWLSEEEARAHGAALLRAQELSAVLARLEVLRGAAARAAQAAEMAHG